MFWVFVWFFLVVVVLLLLVMKWYLYQFGFLSFSVVALPCWDPQSTCCPIVHWQHVQKMAQYQLSLIFTWRQLDSVQKHLTWDHCVFRESDLKNVVKLIVLFQGPPLSVRCNNTASECLNLDIICVIITIVKISSTIIIIFIANIIIVVYLLGSVIVNYCVVVSIFTTWKTGRICHNLRVFDQNGVSRLYIKLEIHRSGWEPLICKC